MKSRLLYASHYGGYEEFVRWGDIRKQLNGNCEVIRNGIFHRDSLGLEGLLEEPATKEHFSPEAQKRMIVLLRNLGIDTTENYGRSYMDLYRIEKPRYRKVIGTYSNRYPEVVFDRNFLLTNDTTKIIVYDVSACPGGACRGTAISLLEDVQEVDLRRIEEGLAYHQIYDSKERRREAEMLAHIPEIIEADRRRRIEK